MLVSYTEIAVLNPPFAKIFVKFYRFLRTDLEKTRISPVLRWWSVKKRIFEFSLNQFFSNTDSTQSVHHIFQSKCNGYGFLVCVLSYRTLRLDFGSQCALETVLRRIYFLMIFYLIQSS